MATLVIACVIVSLFATFGALFLWQDQTSQKGGVSPNVDVSALVSIAVILAFATLVAYAHVTTWDNKELDQGYVCKRVVSALGDWGFQWAPDRVKFSVNDTLGACTAPTRAAWEASYRNRLADGGVALSRLNKALEASGVSPADRRDIILAEDEIWEEARQYKH